MSTCQFFLVGNIHFADLNRCDCIGNDKSFCGISCYCGNITSCFTNFFYCVDNILSSLLLIKFGPGVSPLVLCVQGNFLAAVFTIGFQLNLDFLRSVTAAVIVVSPCLGNCDAGLSWCIAVGDIVAGDLCCVICNCILGYRVYNFFSSLIFRQVFEAVGPVSIFVCCYGLAVFLLAICKKSYSDALRTFAILIVCIVPGLGAFHLSCLGCVSVCDVKSVYTCFVAFHCFLGYGVGDFLTICIFRQVFEGVGPVSRFVCFYSLACCDLSVCKKVDNNALWTLAILIVCIVPGLGYGDGSFFWSVGVSQSGYSSVLAVVGEFVTFWESFLCPGVLDCFSVCFFRKVRYSLFPIVLDAQGNGLSGFFTVCKKTYGNAFRTFSILIFSIVPDLGYCCTGLSWSVAVGDVAAIVGCSVICYFLLSYGVGDFLAVCIFRQISEAVGPVISGCHGLGSCDFAICKKIDGDAFWALAVLIVGIVPGLGSGDVGGCWFMSVGNIVAAYACFITSYRILSYCITNFSINIILWQVLEDIVPISSLIRSYHLACSFCSICKKFYSDTCWSDSVLVVCIIPGLRTADINYSFINVFKSNCLNSIITFLDRLAYIQFSVSCICYSYFNSILSSIISNFGILCLNF